MNKQKSRRIFRKDIVLLESEKMDVDQKRERAKPGCLIYLYYASFR